MTGALSAQSTGASREYPLEWKNHIRVADYVMIGCTGVHHFIMLGVVMHLVWRRDWPPYVTKNVTLVAATGLGSTVSILGSLIACGLIEREPGDTLAQCYVEELLTAVGTALHVFPAIVRVYRNYTLLVLHSAAMWSAMTQLLAVSVPYLIPSFVYMAEPSMAEFEKYRNRCFDDVWMGVAAFVYVATGLSGAIVMVVRMRRVRKQLNEFRLMTTSLAFLLAWSLFMHPTGIWIWRDSPNEHALVMVDNFVSTVVLFWCPIAIPFLRYLQKDEDYVSQFTFGFSRLPTPAQLRASLADQLEVEDLRRKFRKYAAGRVARELPDFYKACMDREQVDCYFERQAMTMAIIDRFVVEGAEQQINISDECRLRILNCDVNRYNIFDEAIAEVLKVMEVNFKADFERTMEFRRLTRAVEREARELAVLRQARLVAEPKDQGEQSSRTPNGRATPRELPGPQSTQIVRFGSNAVEAMEEGKPVRRSPVAGSLLSVISPLLQLATSPFLSTPGRKLTAGAPARDTNETPPPAGWAPRAPPARTRVPPSILRSADPKPLCSASISGEVDASERPSLEAADARRDGPGEGTLSNRDHDDDHDLDRDRSLSGVKYALVGEDEGERHDEVDGGGESNVITKNDNRVFHNRGPDRNQPSQQHRFKCMGSGAGGVHAAQTPGSSNSPALSTATTVACMTPSRPLHNFSWFGGSRENTPPMASPLLQQKRRREGTLTAMARRTGDVQEDATLAVSAGGLAVPEGPALPTPVDSAGDTKIGMDKPKVNPSRPASFPRFTASLPHRSAMEVAMASASGHRDEERRAPSNVAPKPRSPVTVVSDAATVGGSSEAGGPLFGGVGHRDELFVEIDNLATIGSSRSLPRPKLESNSRGSEGGGSRRIFSPGLAGKRARSHLRKVKQSAVADLSRPLSIDWDTAAAFSALFSSISDTTSRRQCTEEPSFVSGNVESNQPGGLPVEVSVVYGSNGVPTGGSQAPSSGLAPPRPTAACCPSPMKRARRPGSMTPPGPVSARRPSASVAGESLLREPSSSPKLGARGYEARAPSPTAIRQLSSSRKESRESRSFRRDRGGDASGRDQVETNDTRERGAGATGSTRRRLRTRDGIASTEVVALPSPQRHRLELKEDERDPSELHNLSARATSVDRPRRDRGGKDSKRRGSRGRRTGACREDEGGDGRLNSGRHRHRNLSSGTGGTDEAAPDHCPRAGDGPISFASPLDMMRSSGSLSDRECSRTAPFLRNGDDSSRPVEYHDRRRSPRSRSSSRCLRNESGSGSRGDRKDRRRRSSAGKRAPDDARVQGAKAKMSAQSNGSRSERWRRWVRECGSNEYDDRGTVGERWRNWVRDIRSGEYEDDWSASLAPRPNGKRQEQPGPEASSDGEVGRPSSRSCSVSPVRSRGRGRGDTAQRGTGVDKNGGSRKEHRGSRPLIPRSPCSKSRSRRPSPSRGNAHDSRRSSSVGSFARRSLSSCGSPILARGKGSVRSAAMTMDASAGTLGTAGAGRGRSTSSSIRHRLSRRHSYESLREVVLPAPSSSAPSASISYRRRMTRMDRSLSAPLPDCSLRELVSSRPPPNL